MLQCAKVEWCSARASEGLLLAYCDGNGGDGDDDPEHDTDCEFDDEEAESNDGEEDDEEDEEESEEEGSDEGDSGAIPAVLLRQGRPNSADDAGSSASDEDPSRRASKRL